jgi:hypothetical protein
LRASARGQKSAITNKKPRRSNPAGLFAFRDIASAPADSFFASLREAGVAIRRGFFVFWAFGKVQAVKLI